MFNNGKTSEVEKKGLPTKSPTSLLPKTQATVSVFLFSRFFSLSFLVSLFNPRYHYQISQFSLPLAICLP
jgi:hypothetical protein